MTEPAKNRVTQGPCASLFLELTLCGKKAGAEEHKRRRGSKLALPKQTGSSSA
eukprot:CAMPEP_0197443566 /NCGR_PEP_ID=MMETSP1175-20131217/9277_1 /TAXON_ID=1003142 /ORGANISM="Triceratium dubium, Strain CCMP147" /LENGTH=52 /DNA_ID=CAMNT_0042974219 /DNA_START=77 /DNA_END=235 /DNA_ORIENTATION=+